MLFELSAGNASFQSRDRERWAGDARQLSLSFPPPPGLPAGAISNFGLEDRSVLTPKYDEDFRRLGFVGH